MPSFNLSWNRNLFCNYSLYWEKNWSLSLQAKIQKYYQLLMVCLHYIRVNISNNLRVYLIDPFSMLKMRKLKLSVYSIPYTQYRIRICIDLQSYLCRWSGYTLLIMLTFQKSEIPLKKSEFHTLSRSKKFHSLTLREQWACDRCKNLVVSIICMQLHTFVLFVCLFFLTEVKIWVHSAK